MIAGWIGDIIGSVFGVLGGVVGTYCSVANTRSAAERTFAIRCAVICWIAASAFLALLFLLPKPYAWFLWIPYCIFLPLAIRWTKAKQAQIREQADRRKKD